ncbi:MAG TPA: twin-arginine translocase TatA/TatE family subunit [Chitinophagales bacterium]|jgi:sec-independent protein translocase protein TatA|nr:twin-arginine translocase TatA/TatE family subunit [Chitinophagales bacterium]HQG37772.1 twin-arginine translocase TatA/TatE family subunit [Chitinophagales bacterium]
MFGMHGTEIWFILAVVILFFGGKKIPELMRGIGQGVREFNTAKNSLKDEFEKGLKEEENKKLPENK